MTRNILHLSRRVAILRRSKHSGDSTKLQQFVRAEKELSAKIKAAKERYYKVTLPMLMEALKKNYLKNEGC